MPHAYIVFDQAACDEAQYHELSKGPNADPIKAARELAKIVQSDYFEGYIDMERLDDDEIEEDGEEWLYTYPIEVDDDDDAEEGEYDLESTNLVELVEEVWEMISDDEDYDGNGLFVFSVNGAFIMATAE